MLNLDVCKVTAGLGKVKELPAVSMLSVKVALKPK
jgi:hypothetical protein